MGQDSEKRLVLVWVMFSLWRVYVTVLAFVELPSENNEWGKLKGENKKFQDITCYVMSLCDMSPCYKCGTISFVMSVCLSVSAQKDWATTGRLFEV